MCLLVCLIATTGRALVLVSSPSFMTEIVDYAGFNKIDDSLNWNHLGSVYSFVKMLDYAPQLKSSNERHINRNISEDIVEELLTVKWFHEHLFSYERLAHNKRLANVVFKNILNVDYGALFTIEPGLDQWPTFDFVNRSLLPMINSPNLIAREYPLEILIMTAQAKNTPVSPDLFLLISPEVIRKYLPSIEAGGMSDFTWNILIFKVILFSEYQNIYPANLHETAKLWLKNRMAGDRDLALESWNHLFEELQSLYGRAALEVHRKRCTFAILDYILEAVDIFPWVSVEKQCAQALRMLNPQLIPAFKLNLLFEILSVVRIDLLEWLGRNGFAGIFFADHILPWHHRSLNYRLRTFLLHYTEYVDTNNATIAVQNSSLESLVSSKILHRWNHFGQNNEENPAIIMNLRLDQPVKINQRLFKTPKEVMIRYAQRLRRNLFNGAHWRVPTSLKMIEVLLQMIPFFICHRLTLSLPAFPNPKYWSEKNEELAVVIARSLAPGISPVRVGVLAPLIAERLIDGLQSLLVYLEYREILQLLGNAVME